MKDPTPIILFVSVFVIALLCCLLSSAIVSCGWGKGTCEIIDVAHYACDVLPIRYLGPDGKEHVVMVPKQEVVGVAQRVEAQQKDAGTD